MLNNSLNKVHEIVTRKYIADNETIHTLNVTVISEGGCGINIGNTLLDLSPMTLNREQAYNGFLVTSNSKEKDGDRNFSPSQVLWLTGEDGNKMEGASRNLEKVKSVFPWVYKLIKEDDKTKEITRQPSEFSKIETKNFNDFMGLLKKYVTKETDIVLIIAGSGGGTGAALLKDTIDITHTYIHSMLKAGSKIALGAVDVFPVHTFGEVENAYIVTREILTGSYERGRLDFIIPIDNELLESQYNYMLEEADLDTQNRMAFEKLNHEEFVNQLFANWLHEIIVASSLDANRIDRGDIHRVLKQSGAGMVLIEKNVLKEENLADDEDYNILNEILKSIKTPTFMKGYDIDTIKNISVIVVNPKGGSPLTDKKETTLDSDLKKTFKNADFIKLGQIESRFVNDSEIVYYIIAKFDGYPERIANIESEYLKLKNEKEASEKKAKKPTSIFSAEIDIAKEESSSEESEQPVNPFSGWSLDSISTDNEDLKSNFLGGKRSRRKNSKKIRRLPFTVISLNYYSILILLSFNFIDCKFN